MMILSKKGYILLGTFVVLAALAVGGTMIVQAHRADSASQPDPATQVQALTLPEGTALHVCLAQAVSSNQSRSGEEFAATVSEPVVVDNYMVIPPGTPVRGRVVEAKPSGRLKGRGEIRLALTEVDLNGSAYDLNTTSTARAGRSHKARNWWWIGGGGAGGATIGAIAGGGKGALIGGPIGAGAGTLVAFLTGKHDVRLPAETPLLFKLKQPITVDVARSAEVKS